MSKPYAFHTVMRSMLVPLKLAADARGLDLISEFDPAIDDTIRKANRVDEIKRGMGQGDDKDKALEDEEEEEAVVIGDEVGICSIFRIYALTNVHFDVLRCVCARLSQTLRVTLPSSPSRAGRSLSGPN